MPYRRRGGDLRHERARETDRPRHVERRRWRSGV